MTTPIIIMCKTLFLLKSTRTGEGLRVRSHKLKVRVNKPGVVYNVETALVYQGGSCFQSDLQKTSGVALFMCFVLKHALSSDCSFKNALLVFPHHEHNIRCEVAMVF